MTIRELLTIKQDYAAIAATIRETEEKTHGSLTLLVVEAIGATASCDPTVVKATAEWLGTAELPEGQRPKTLKTYKSKYSTILKAGTGAVLALTDGEYGLADWANETLAGRVPTGRDAEGNEVRLTLHALYAQITALRKTEKAKAEAREKQVADDLQVMQALRDGDPEMTLTQARAAVEEQKAIEHREQQVKALLQAAISADVVDELLDALTAHRQQIIGTAVAAMRASA